MRKLQTQMVSPVNSTEFLRKKNNTSSVQMQEPIDQGK